MIPAGTTRQLPFEQFRGPCPHTSNGQPCRYYADHDPTPHTYGGGLCDPVRNSHCGTPEQHTSHAWTHDDKAWFNCSGAPLGSAPAPTRQPTPAA